MDAISAKLDLESKLQQEEYQRKIAFILFGSIIFAILVSVMIYFNRYRKIRKLNHKLNEMNETKNRLFSVISHDLRGPMLSANQLIESLSTKYDQFDETSKYNLLTNIHHSTNKVVDLLENLLQWSQFQIKSNKIKKEEISIREAIQEVIDQVEYLSKSKQIEIILDCVNCEKIIMNRNEFEVVIRNLLTNSLKFSEEGEKIEIRGKKTDGITILEVVDYGLGMIDGTRNLVLDTSTSNHRKENKGEKGSGLGLLIVNDILERNNGKIEFLPNKPKGIIARIEILN